MSRKKLFGIEPPLEKLFEKKFSAEEPAEKKITEATIVSMAPKNGHCQCVKERILKYLIPILIALSLSTALFHFSSHEALQNYDNLFTFTSYQDGELKTAQMRPAWHPRVYSNYLASQLVWLKYLTPATERTKEEQIDKKQFKQALGFWWATWFFLTCAIYIVARKGGYRSTFLIFGSFCAVIYDVFVPEAAHTRVYPWDAPALFFFSVIVLAIEKQSPLLLLATMFVGMGFKETAIVGCFAFAVWPNWTKHRRLKFLVASLLLCVATKIALDICTGGQKIFFTMQTAYEPEDNRLYVFLIENLDHLWRWRLYTPWCINAGTLLVFLLLPVRNPRILTFKLIATIFIACNLFFGRIMEFAIWLEMVPVALCAIEYWTDDSA